MKTNACVLLFLMSFFVVTSLTAADTFKYNGIQYMKTPDYGFNTVAVIQDTYSGDVVIPNWATDNSDQSVYKVVAINRYAFYSCPELTSVVMGDSILYIQADVFSYSTQLSSVLLSSHVQSLGNNAFTGCTGLLSVNLPGTLTVLGSAVFSNCSALTEINVSPFNPLYASSNGILYNKNVEHVLNCPGGKTGEIVLPSTVKRISNDAFSGCSKITSVIVPDDVELIPANAFLNCTSLSTISLGEKLTVIDSYAFKNCTALMFVQMPNLVYNIKNNAFENCTTLDFVGFSDALTVIGEKCFLNCSNLNSFTLPENVVRIDKEAFKGCTDLTEVSLSDSLKTLGQDVFASCSKLTSIYVSNLNNYFSSKEGVLYTKNYKDLICCPAGKTGAVVVPETVKTLYPKSFYDCVHITSVTLPSSLNALGIGSYAFYGCTGLTSLHANGAVPVDLISSTQTFGNVNRFSCTLYVPTGSLTAYRNANQWKDFFNIEEETITNLSATTTSSMQAQVNGFSLAVSNLRSGQVIRVYNSNGTCLFTATADNSNLKFQLPSVGTYLVSDGIHTIKVACL